MTPVALIIRDGWGYRQDPRGNAVKAAHTPNLNSYLDARPWTLIEAAGEAVGLPEGYQGSSEVGHLNMGAGRIVVQELKRINDGIKDGSLFSTGPFQRLIDNCQEQGSRLHLMGLLQDQGVHAHCDHLFSIMRAVRDRLDVEIIVHVFTDGRDTPPKSSVTYIDELEKVMGDVGGCRVGTLMGRYYAMDRSRNWKLTDIAFDCIVNAQGRPAASACDAVEESYAKDETPDHGEMFDEYIPPYVIQGYDGITDGDSILHTNFRQDRAIQLSMAFTEDDYPGERRRRPDCYYVGLTRYYNEFRNYILEPMGSGSGMANLLGEVISRCGLKQLRLAETQKFRHVTSFFNGKSTQPFPGEDQIEIPSQYDPALFASHPEMNAYDVRDKLLELTREESPYSLYVVNFANCDMVGHTGNLEAAIEAVEVVDQCVGDCVKRLSAMNVEILVTADHGNVEEMLDPVTNSLKTSHSINPVELIYIGSGADGHRLKAGGKLSDIAPTVLHLLGLEAPAEMTAQSLLHP